MRDLKRIILLTAAILGLGYYLYHSDRLAHEQSEGRLKSKKILQIDDKSRIESLLLETRGRETVGIARENGHWWIVKPFRYEADDRVADGLLSALTLTTWERSFSAAEVNAEEMGLADPGQKITVTLRADEGLEKRRLLIGRDAPMGRYVYARWEEAGEIYMLYDQFAKSFDKSLYALRKKSVFEASSDEISAVRVFLEGRNFALVKQDGKWKPEGGADGSIDAVKAETFLSDLAGLYVKEFLDGLDPQNPDLGLAERKYSVRLTLKDGSEKILWIGRENKDKEAFYGLKEGENTVLLIPESKIWEMPRSLKSFLKKPDEAAKPEFARVMIAKEKTELEAVKVDGKWGLKQGAKGLSGLLDHTVNELIGYLEDADFGEPDPAIKELPKQPETLYVKLVTPDRKSREYTFYKKDNTIVGQLSSVPGYLRLDESVWEEVNGYYEQMTGLKKS